MAHTPRHNETLPRRKIDDAVLEIDEEMSIENEKEFIDILVFVPMIFPLDHRQPDHRVIYRAKRLVIPFVCAPIG